MRQLRDYLPSVMLSGDSSRFIDSFLRIYQKMVLRDDGDSITVFTTHASRLVRAAAPIASASGNTVALSRQDPGPTAFRPGDKVRVTETATDVHHISTVSHVSWSSQDSQYKLVLADVLPPAPFTPDFIRTADIEPSDRRFRVETEHGISPGSRIVVTQGATIAESTTIGVDGDFIHLNRGLANATGSFSQDLAAEPILIRVMHDPVEKTIDDLRQLLDPWKTRPDFLPWLASLLSLDIEPNWGEYQQRFLVSQIAALYHKLGTKAGLLTFLDIYASTRGQSRICLDDGESIFRLRILDESNATIELLAQSSFYSDTPNTPQISLLHPTAIVETQSHDFFVADIGGADSNSNHPAAIWKISSSGNILGDPLTNQLFRPISLAFDANNDLLVLDGGVQNKPSRLLRWDGATLQPVFPPLPPNVKPLGLSYFTHPDDGGDCFAILAISYTGATDPTIQIYHDNSGTIQLTTHDLSPSIAMPVCFLKLREFEFFVSDGKSEGSKEPANLFHVKLKKGDNGLEAPPAPLLDPTLGVDVNTLIWPSGITNDSADMLLVCDTGLRHGRAGSADRAELPAVYRVHLPSAAGAYGELKRIGCERKLTNPAAILKHRSGALYLLDNGNYNLMGSGIPPLEYRAKPHQASIVEHFSKEVHQDEQFRIRARIRQVLEQFSPAHVTVHIKGIFTS